MHAPERVSTVGSKLPCLNLCSLLDTDKSRTSLFKVTTPSLEVKSVSFQDSVSDVGGLVGNSGGLHSGPGSPRHNGVSLASSFSNALRLAASPDVVYPKLPQQKRGFSSLKDLGVSFFFVESGEEG